MTDVSRARGRRLFGVLLAIFFVPLFAAAILYFGFPELAPARTTNYGELISPARPAPPAFELPLRGKWTLLVASDADCPADCEALLVQARQIRLALNDKAERVRLVLVAGNAVGTAALEARLRPVHPDLVILPDAERSFAGFLGAQAAGIQLLDPHANWLLHYAPGADSHGIFKDLKKVLSLSQIG